MALNDRAAGLPKVVGWLALTVALAAFCGSPGCSVRSSTSIHTISAPSTGDWIRTEVFFGLSEHGTPIAAEQWQDFVDKTITPRFPDGLAIVYGNGQYRTSGAEVTKEPTAILILLHKKETWRRDDAILNSIAKEYDVRFQQESVLRCDSDARVEFISAGKGG
jgi:hypothetical protein